MRGEAVEYPASVLHADFAKAVAEALRLGFDPEHDLWVVEHRHWATHYAPGARPVTVPRVISAEASAEHTAAALREEK